MPLVFLLIEVKIVFICPSSRVLFISLRPTPSGLGGGVPAEVSVGLSLTILLLRLKLPELPGRTLPRERKGRRSACVIPLLISPLNTSSFVEPRELL